MRLTTKLERLREYSSQEGYDAMLLRIAQQSEIQRLR